MPMPKSVTKIDKNGVKYISSVDRTSYTIQELTRAALKDVAKFVRREAKANAPKQSGDYKKNIATWVRKDRRTGEFELQLGVYTAKQSKKKNKNAIYFAHIIEFGSRFVGGLKVLTNAVQSNIATIIQIESQYLSAIENEAKAITLLDEKDEVSDA